MVRGLVALRAGEVEVEAETIRGVDPRVRHVVAVADPRVLETRDVADVLAHREQVCKDLAGVQQIGETVDHRLLRGVGEPDQVLM